MGRKSSHVALECALQSSPNMVCLCLMFFVILPLFSDSQVNNFTEYYVQVILSEEVASLKLTLFDITQRICDAVEARAEQG